jgi:hypothetical protein
LIWQQYLFQNRIESGAIFFYHFQKNTRNGDDCSLTVVICFGYKENSENQRTITIANFFNTNDYGH